MLPYDPALLIGLWDSIFTTIGSASNLGFYIFEFVAGIAIFIKVVQYFVGR